MRSRILFATIIALIIAVTSHAQAPVKSYELYSWKIKSHWYYSLLPRSTTPKSYAEITTNKSVRRDTSGLEAELRKLPKGEEVFWMGDAPGPAQHTAQKLDLKHPSRKRIKRIKAICAKLGIELKLAY